MARKKVSIKTKRAEADAGDQGKKEKSCRKDLRGKSDLRDKSQG